MKIIPVDSLGWPVERFKGRPFINFLRLIIHTRGFTTEKRFQYFMEERRKMATNNTGAYSPNTRAL